MVYIICIILSDLYAVSQKKSKPKCFVIIFHKAGPILIKYCTHEMSMNKYATNYCKRFPLHLSIMHFLVKLKSCSVNTPMLKNYEVNKLRVVAIINSLWLYRRWQSLWELFLYARPKVQRCGKSHQRWEPKLRMYTFALWYCTSNSCLIESLFFVDDRSQFQCLSVTPRFYF